MAVKPVKLTLRSYAVGFGDCFLLSFDYGGATETRHVLIDFGTIEKPPNARTNLMKDIANDIAAVTAGTLHMLVATHRHTDHISGFRPAANGKGTGDIIAKLKPKLIVQPWTERLDAPENFEGTGQALAARADDAFRVALARMRTVTEASLRSIRHLPQKAAGEIAFIGADSIKNLESVKHLAKMGKNAYVRHGSKLPGIAKLLPGVKVTVLGPPTIKQKADVVHQNPVNKEEFWHFSRFWNLRVATSQLEASGGALFPGASVQPPRQIPIENRWLVRELKQVRASQLLRIVTAMDNAMNNTSVILLFEAGGKKYLFPGDAQWENWEFALDKNADALKDVDVYKVGHHGSLNATPKTLWRGFAKKSDDPDKKNRLVTVMSTVSDSKHGDPEHESEVPRGKLVTELKANSTHRSTQELEPTGGMVLTLEFDLT